MKLPRSFSQNASRVIRRRRSRNVVGNKNTMKGEAMTSALSLYGSILAGALLMVAPDAGAAPLLSHASLDTAADVVRIDGAVARRGGARAGGAAVRRTTVVGPRGGVARRTTVVRPGGAWARPGHYYWRRGGAVAAGAAIGFVTAATAAAWAGAAPAPGMCWYYTDPSRRQGFWDYCK
jgi:hypothetical protein